MDAQQSFAEEIKREGKSTKIAWNDSLAEGILGGAAGLLALIGLLGIRREIMLPVAAILMGAGFLLEGEAISVRVSRLFARTGGERLQDEQPRVGVTAEFISGAVGLVLGFLALLGLYPLVTVPIAAIVYGSALIFGSGLTARINDLETESSGEPACFRKAVCEAMASASGVEFLFGLIAGILGIIALTGMNAVRTSLAALLIVGLSSLLNGTAIIARIRGTHGR